MLIFTDIKQELDSDCCFTVLLSSVTGRKMNCLLTTFCFFFTKEMEISRIEDDAAYRVTCYFINEILILI